MTKKIPRAFTSPGGRRFTIAGHKSEDSPWGIEEQWTIFYRGKPAGKLFRDSQYGKELPWHATTRQIYWQYASDAPTGVGFDVSAFATIDEVFKAWGHSADQILDWSEDKLVSTLASASGRDNPAWAKVFG